MLSTQQAPPPGTVQDKEASESMEAACNLMQMGSLLRSAIRLIKGLRIKCGGLDSC